MKAAIGKTPDRMISRRIFLRRRATRAALFSGMRAIGNRDRAEISTPSVPKVPPGREMRIVHLSDLHIRHFDRYFEKWPRR